MIKFNFKNPINNLFLSPIKLNKDNLIPPPKGKTKTREKILSNFIERHKDDSGPDLEEEFADAGSLFLTRITTWLRLTSVCFTSIKEKL